MPHDTGAPVGKLQILHRGKKRLDFNLDRLRQKLPRTSSQRMGWTGRALAPNRSENELGL
jgi:hypothetical protein